MSNRNRLTAWLTAGAVSFAGVAALAQTTGGTGAGAPGMATANATVDQLFAMSGTESNLFEIASSRLVVDKGANAAVKQHAQRMIEDHRKAQADLEKAAGEQLMGAAGTRMVSGNAATMPIADLSAMLTPPKRLMVANLQSLSGADLDRSYVAGQVNAHEATVMLLNTEVKLGNNQELKAYAQKALPVVQQHLVDARKLPGAPR